jgi:tRNA(His) guanylyltransferase
LKHGCAALSGSTANAFCRAFGSSFVSTGRGFGRFTAARFEKPFDPRLRDLMCVAARALLINFNALYAYTMSDEISLLLPPRWDLFGRVVEKIVSISFGLASAAFTQAYGEPAHFDIRIWLGVNEEAVIDYFRWRQSDAGRNALHSWCYWTLRKSGTSQRRRCVSSTIALRASKASYCRNVASRCA